MQRRQFLTGSLGVIVGSPADAVQHPLNFLILKSDEHNPLYSSVYGHPFVRTPNMERLARMGTVFENNYTPSPLCRPARSAWMSGRRVHEIQCYSNCSVFTHDLPSYGRILREQGIHTVHIGKTDVYNRADTLGFSEILLPGDRPSPGDTYISRQPLAIRTGDGEARADGFGVRENPFAHDDQIIKEAVRWLSTTAPKLHTAWTLNIITVAPSSSNVVYAGSTDGRLFVSTTASSLAANSTNTAAWINVSAGLQNASIGGIAVDRTNPAIVYAAHRKYGLAARVYKSINSGATWTNITGNLPDTPVNSLMLHPADATTLFAATDS